MLDIAGVDPSYNNMCKSIQTLFSSVYNIDIDFTDKKNLAAFFDKCMYIYYIKSFWK